MNRLIPVLFFALSGLSFAVAAQTTQTTGPVPAPVADAPVTADPAADRSSDPFAADAAADPDEAAASENRLAQEKARAEHPYCLRETGSLIRPRGAPQRCTGIGQAYTREDLQRTGQTDIGDALRVLSSSIR